MTLEQIEQSLPAGFHDAKLHDISLGIVSDFVALKLSLWVPGEEEGEWELYRDALVTLQKPVTLRVPERGPETYEDDEYVTIDGSGEEPESWECAGLASSCSDLVPYWFFVFDWNDFLYVGHRSAELKWTSEPYVNDDRPWSSGATAPQP